VNQTSSATPLPLGEGDSVIAAALHLPKKTKLQAKPRIHLVAVYFVLAVLLYFALRNAPVSEILNALHRLELWQIAVLAAINIFIYMLVTLRWWIVIRAGRKNVAYLPLVLVRIAVFGVSYFTLGPQIGGEALQIFYLQRRHGMSYTRATSTVIMDKLLEFLANFFLLVFGAAAVLQAGILSTNGNRPFVSLIPVAVLLAWPPIHILLMMHGKYPVAAILRMVFSRFGNPKWMRFITASERMAARFCQRYPRALWMAVAVSLLAGIGMVMEYALIASFLGINLHGWQTLAAWTTSWLAFLIPLPGGLGALEASQVFTLGAFEISAALAIGVALLIRARDLLIGGLGLAFASRALEK
jgi:glycosyltransferase 2 family protein